MSGLHWLSCHGDGPLRGDDEMQDSLPAEQELRGEEAPSPKIISLGVLWQPLKGVAGAPAARSCREQEEQGLSAATAPQLQLHPSLLITFISAGSPV